MGQHDVTSSWRFAFASVRGTSHLRSDQPVQDFASCSVVDRGGGETVLIACVADGAGSAPRGEAGAALACTSFAEAVQHIYAAGYPGRLLDPTRARRGWSLFVKRWLRRFRRSVGEIANAEERRPRDFACTFLAVVVEASRAGFAQVGDGVIVVADSPDPDRYSYVFWPQRGEHANETHFLTESDADSHLESDVSEIPVREVALLTDGTQVFALDYANHAVHELFFRGMFPPVRRLDPGYSPELSRLLADFLDSPRVRAHTDDDKTLVLATRRESGARVDDRAG